MHPTRQALTVIPPPAPEDESSSPSASEAPAKGGRKDKAKAAAATDKTVAPAATPGNMIVEASLDWSGEEVLTREFNATSSQPVAYVFQVQQAEHRG